MLRPSMLAIALASATAFAPLGMSTGGLRRHFSSLSMQLSAPSTPIDIFKGMDGEGQEVRSSPFLIESEIKHGRLAMLAAVGYPAAELLHPFIADTANLPSLLTEAGAAPNFLNGGLEALVAKFNLTLVFVVVAMLGRVYNIEIDALQSRNNFLSSDPKEQFPYDLGFDPLGLYAKNTPAQRKTMAEKELNNGRLAMVAVALYPLIEFASKQPLLQLTLASEE